MSENQQLLRHGWQLHQSGKIDEAEDCYRRAIAKSPRDADALVYLGIALFDKRQYQESVTAYRQALKLRRPFPIAWNNLGNSLRMLGQLEEAESCFAEALKQQPDYLSVFKNRGTLWVWAGEIERGLKWYEQGLQIDPSNAELHRNLGVINLLKGNYDIGWSEYRWRWKMPGMYRPAITSPVWRGESLAGKRILMYPEQGNGDAIHFVRVAKSLQGLGASVVLQCSNRLIPLFTSAPGVDRLVIENAAAPNVAFHVSMIEAIDLLYQQTGEIAWGDECFESGQGYLTVSAELIQYWSQWLDREVPRGNDGDRRIGINWQGNPDHHADIYRSVPLTTMQPLTSLEQVKLISLQFGFGSEQMQVCDFRSSMIGLPSHVDTDGGAFTDTAAILQNLDAVVTTDTAIAHLAGAVGTPVYLMLGRVPDWRWLLDSSTTRWYPSMQLVRQKELGCWDQVIEEVTEKLRF